MLRCIPHKVRFTHKISYEVLWVDRFDESNVLGICDYQRRQIRLHKNLKGDEALSVFFHEILHAMAYEYEFSLTESQVEAIELGFKRFFKLNKGV